jgi:hypothetical protein
MRLSASQGAMEVSPPKSGEILLEIIMRQERSVYRPSQQLTPGVHRGQVAYGPGS